MNRFRPVRLPRAAFSSLPAMALAAGLLVAPGPLAPTLHAAAAQAGGARSDGALSGPAFVEAAGLYSRFQVEAGAIALRNASSEAMRTHATRTIAEFERVSSSLRIAAEAAGGRIEPPTRLDGAHEVWLERLRAAKGSQFDALYAQILAEATGDAKGVFAAYARSGDQSALKAYAEETLPVLERHRQAAAKIEIRS